jgi:hypothetical protein
MAVAVDPVMVAGVQVPEVLSKIKWPKVRPEKETAVASVLLPRKITVLVASNVATPNGVAADDAVLCM